MPDYIHYEPNRTLYALSEDELNILAEKSQPLWKDTCLVSIGIGLPTLINAIADTNNEGNFTISLDLFLNYMFGILGIILGIVFAIAWYKSHKNTANILKRIKEKPRSQFNGTTSDVGALETRPAKYS